jgi:hypothetical protein
MRPVYIYIYIQTHAHIHTYTHAYIYIYTVLAFLLCNLCVFAALSAWEVIPCTSSARIRRSISSKEGRHEASLCIDSYIYIYIYICMNMCMYIVHESVYACVYVDVYVRVCVLAWVHQERVYVHRFFSKEGRHGVSLCNMCVCVSVYMHVCIYDTCICVWIYIIVSLHACVHFCMHVSL